MKVNNTSWGAVADWYDDLIKDSEDSYQKKVIMPNIIRILQPKKDMRILDVACGQGYFARAFHQNGANVVGCDISAELVDIAKKHTPKERESEINFFALPSDKLHPEWRDFDAVTVIMALQNIENLSGTIAECSRVLKAGGRLLAVINHPAFRIPRKSSWQWDENAGSQFRRIDAYMSDEQQKIDMSPGENDKLKKKFTVSFHRPIQSYFKAMAKSGFAVVRMEEWISHKKSQSGPRAAEEDRIRKEIPMFLCLEAKKIS